MMVEILDWLQTYPQRPGRPERTIFRALNEKNMEPRILYPARLSLKIEGEVERFQDKQKIKEFANTKPALQEILKGLL